MSAVALSSLGTLISKGVLLCGFRATAGQITDDFVETKLKKMVSSMREYGASGQFKFGALYCPPL